MSLLLPADLDARAARLRAELSARVGCAEEAVRIVRAPYRLCPLGAHVDHQFGPVCALALDHALLFAWVPTDGARIELSSQDFEGEIAFDVHAVGAREGDWGDYARGAVRSLVEAGRSVGGLVGRVDGALGESGLSSSAAVGVAYLLALAARGGESLEGDALVRAQGRIEQDYLGLANGLLDPAAVVFSAADALVRIDTRTLDNVRVHRSGGPALRFLAVSSGQRAALVAGTRFNDRVAECREAARRLAERIGFEDPTPRLGDLPRDVLADARLVLPEYLARRTRHFLTETARVDAALHAWERSDVTAFGDAMRASARSSIDDYETGSPAMVDLLEILLDLPGVHGARFSGAGYRGCCVALVDANDAEGVAGEALERYARVHPELAAESFALASAPAAGAGLL